MCSIAVLILSFPRCRSLSFGKSSLFDRLSLAAFSFCLSNFLRKPAPFVGYPPHPQIHFLPSTLVRPSRLPVVHFGGSAAIYRETNITYFFKLDSTISGATAV
ncbi:hypothetical protein BKA80DRAFT_59352 [Phyllosticta citrichinensis]